MIVYEYFVLGTLRKQSLFFELMWRDSVTRRESTTHFFFFLFQRGKGESCLLTMPALHMSSRAATDVSSALTFTRADTASFAIVLQTRDTDV